MSHIQNYLIVTALGSQAPLNINELTRACHQCGCNILHLKMNQLGQEMAVFLYLTGNWGAIAKIETALISLEKQLGLKIQVKRSFEATASDACHTYSIRITAIDKSGILSGLTHFLQLQRIPIIEMNIQTYHARQGTRMLSMDILVQIPDQLHLATLREALLNYCDTHNLDAFLEPERN